MKILITGGTGNIGSVTAAHLIENGHQVRVVSLEENADIPSAEYIQGDITDYASLGDMLAGCEAVVHLAAIAAPSMAPADKLFDINVRGTFNVFEAAAKAGIKRVVQASSINAIGCAYNTTDVVPAYFPIDEDHPHYTTDPYSLSKQLDEDIAAYFWRRDGISSTSLRFPWVYPGEYHKSEDYLELRKTMTSLLDELVNQDEATRSERLATIREQVLAYRQARSMEVPKSGQAMSTIPDQDHLLWRAYHIDRFNFWAFLDVRDAARSIEQSLMADFEGSHPLFIGDTVNWLGYDSETLLRLFYPEITERKHPIHGDETLVSVEKARQLIGFAPQHTVKGL